MEDILGVRMRAWRGVARQGPTVRLRTLPRRQRDLGSAQGQERGWRVHCGPQVIGTDRPVRSHSSPRRSS